MTLQRRDLFVDDVIPHMPEVITGLVCYLCNLCHSVFNRSFIELECYLDFQVKASVNDKIREFASVYE